MRRKEVMELAHDRLVPLWLKERAKQTEFREWARGKHVKPFKPEEANAEYDALLEKSPVPLIGLVVKILAQTMELQDYQPGIAENHDALWNIWQTNRMKMRQKRLYRASLTGGAAFTLLLPGEPVPVAQIFSSRNMIAVYQDAEADEWPMFAGFGEYADPTHYHFTVVDEGELHRIQIGPEGQDPQFIETSKHGAGITPVVRYAGEVDDEGAVTGEVEPLIPIQANIDQTNFDRLLTQSFASWKIRYITGMAKPATQTEADQVKMVLERDRLLLIENPDAKVGTLDGTELAGYIEARRDSKQDLASVSQVAQKVILGSQSNNADGAEAQAAEEASTQRKIHDYTLSFGEAHSQFFRLGGHLAGVPGAWEDYGGHSDWANSEIRSMSQVADAIGKLATQVDIPKEGLWELVPGITPEKIKRWQEMRARDPYGQMLRALDDEPDNPVG